MERHEGPQTPYEVYCYSCRVTFAAGTPQCIHCGQRLGKPARVSASGDAAILEEVEPEAAEANPLRRAGSLSLWVLLVVGATIARMCEGG